MSVLSENNLSRYSIDVKKERIVIYFDYEHPSREFSVFEQEKTFQKLIEFALQVNKENQITLPNQSYEQCNKMHVSLYSKVILQSLQSELDRKQLEKDPNN